MKKIIGFATALILLNFGFQPLRSYGQAGSLDLTFSTDGMTTTPIFTPGGLDNGYAIAVQSDGKILLAGGGYNPSLGTLFTVARYNDNGTLDFTFSGDGIATGVSGVARGIVIQPDGKILVAGNGSNGSNQDFIVARFETNGTLDATFGTAGVVMTNLGINNDYGRAIALQSDGKIVVTGDCFNGFNDDYAVVRYNPDGSLDLTFDSDGIVLTPITSNTDEPNAVAIQSNGKIVVAGMSNTAGFTVVRYNTDGSLDLTFDTDGIVQTTLPGSTAYSMAIQTDGKIVVAGESSNGTNDDFTIVRYNTNGSVDNTFGTAGVVTTPIGTLDDVARAVILQPDGRIVVGGYYSPAATEYSFAMARYTTSGVLDTYFDGDGKVTTDLGGLLDDDRIFTLAIQPADGKIVAGGYGDMAGSVDFAIARYIGACALTATPGTITGNATPCIGSTQTYSISAVSGATGYTWSVPAGSTVASGQGTTSATITFGSTPGNISVTADNNCGPSAAQNLAFTLVTTLATPGNISGNTSVCSGSSNTYSITAVSGATGYTWTVPSGTIINSGQNTTSITVTAGANSGNVSVTANNVCGSSTPKTLTVTNLAPAQPGTITGNSASCSGASETYSIAAVSGATGYVWTAPPGGSVTAGQGTTTATITMGSVTGNVSVASSNSCGNSTPKTISVNVTSVPAMPGTISGNMSVCAGASNVTYSISPVFGAVWYVWSVPPGTVINSGSTSASINVTFGSSPGPITVSAHNSCGGSAAQTTPTLISTPYSFFNYTAVNLAVTFGNLCANASTYSWMFGDGGISAAPSPVHNYPASGTYTVELTATGACGSHYYTKNITITDSTSSDDVSVEEIENVLHVAMYPNPTNGKFKILMEGENITGNENFQVVILNSFGQLMRQFELNAKESEIDLSTFSNGIYFVKCIFNDRECMMKMIKE